MFEPFWDWDEDREWRAKDVAKLLSAIHADFRNGNFSIDLVDKIKSRRIAKHDIWNVLHDPETFIGRYCYQSGNRVGLWNPHSKIFVAWKQRQLNSPSRIMTVFREGNGVDYMRGFPSFREIQGPKR